MTKKEKKNLYKMYIKYKVKNTITNRCIKFVIMQEKKKKIKHIKGKVSKCTFFLALLQI